MFRSIAATLLNFIAQYLPPIGFLSNYNSASRNPYQSVDFKSSQGFRSEPNLQAPLRTTRAGKPQNQRPNQIAERYEKVCFPVPVRGVIFDYSDIL